MDENDEQQPLKFTTFQKRLFWTAGLGLLGAALFMAAAYAAGAPLPILTFIGTLTTAAATFVGIVFATDRGLQNALHVVKDTRTDYEQKAVAAIFVEMKFNAANVQSVAREFRTQLSTPDGLHCPDLEYREVVSQLPDPDILMLESNAADIGRFPPEISAAILTFYRKYRDVKTSIDLWRSRQSRCSFQMIENIANALAQILNSSAGKLDVVARYAARPARLDVEATTHGIRLEFERIATVHSWARDELRKQGDSQSNLS